VFIDPANEYQTNLILPPIPPREQSLQRLEKFTVLILSAWVGSFFFSPFLATRDGFIRISIHFLGFGLFHGCGNGFV